MGSVVDDLRVTGEELKGQLTLAFILWSLPDASLRRLIQHTYFKIPFQRGGVKRKDWTIFAINNINFAELQSCEIEHFWSCGNGVLRKCWLLMGI